MQARLEFSAVLFGVLWTAGMILWSMDFSLVNMLILSVCGTIAAIFWYWAMAQFMRWQAARNAS